MTSTRVRDVIMPSLNVDDYVAGALGGMSGMIVGHPLDTIKVLLQTQQHSKTHRGMMRSVVSTGKHGLAGGYFRGLSFPLASVAAVNAVFFGVYGSALSRLRLDVDDLGSSLSKQAGYLYAAGCVAGLAQTVVACPSDLVKVVLQSQLNNNATIGLVEYFGGPLQALMWLYRRHGIRGLYRGYTVFLMRDVPSSGIYIAVYEILYNCLCTTRTDGKFTDSGRVFASLTAGGVAGVASWVIAVPFDVVKSLIQADVTGSRYTGLLDCVITVYRANGIRGFFSGLSVVCLRAFPVNAITFFVYSHTLDYLQDSCLLHVSFGSQ